MKKIWPIVLLGILLLCISCVKEKAAETDLIFEGKTYVIGSGKPPKGQPMKMLIYKANMSLGLKAFFVIDSFYTNSSGYFNFRYQPSGSPSDYLVQPEFRWGYDSVDKLYPKRFGRHTMEFRLIGYGTLKLRIKNANYTWGDSLVIIDPYSVPGSYSGPLAYDHIFNLLFPAFEPLNFEFRLYRNGLESIWKERYVVHDDSVHYHEIIY